MSFWYNMYKEGAFGDPYDEIDPFENDQEDDGVTLGERIVEEVEELREAFDDLNAVPLDADVAYAEAAERLQNAIEYLEFLCDGLQGGLQLEKTMTERDMEDAPRRPREAPVRVFPGRPVREPQGAG